MSVFHLLNENTFIFFSRCVQGLHQRSLSCSKFNALRFFFKVHCHIVLLLATRSRFYKNLKSVQTSDSIISLKRIFEISLILFEKSPSQNNEAKRIRTRNDLVRWEQRVSPVWFSIFSDFFLINTIKNSSSAIIILKST